MSHPQGRVPAHVLDGIFATWEEANRRAAEVGGEGLAGDRWLQRITRQITDYREEYRQHGSAMPPRPCNLPLVCATTDPRVIVDFGGSSGWGWDYLQNSLPRNAVSSYVVVETRAVVDYMKGAGLHGAPVDYVTLQDRPGACDLLYCNSVLQYFESNLPLLSLVECTDPRFVLLEDVAATAGNDFFSVQSHYGSAIPYRFPGLRGLLGDLSRSGYTALARFPYASPVDGVIKPLEMENFPDSHQVRYSSSILFEKVGKR